MLSIFPLDLAIDLGTANTLIYTRRDGICLNEPSVIAVSQSATGRSVVAVGAAAKRMEGRTPHGITVMRPIRGGAIADYELARAMLGGLVRKVVGRHWSPFKPRMIIGVPPGLTDIERRAIREAGLSLGAREVFLLDEAMAAALGCGLQVKEPIGNLIVDIGGGTTDIAAISLGGVIQAKSLRIAGDNLDEAINQHLRKDHRLSVASQTIEEVKKNLGAALPNSDDEEVSVQGQSLADGCPETKSISGREVRLALESSITEIIEAVREVLELIPPAVAGDVLDHGISLTGGSSLIKGLDERLRDELRVPVQLASDPLFSVVEGVGQCLNNKAYRELLT